MRVTDLALDAHSVIVMAHPDDEVLWASSALARAGRVILAYEALPGRPDVTEGRRAALARFPRPVESLRLTETGAFGAAAWPDPVETPEGLDVTAGRAASPGFDPAGYRARFAELRDRLRPVLAGARTVITHAPWGEYGHEDHVQLCRAVEALRDELGLALFVPAYVSARSAAPMSRALGRLGAPTPPMPTDRALAAELKALYRATGCWTWADDHEWPEAEVFYPLLPAPAPTPAPSFPMTVVPAPGERPPLPRGPSGRLMRRIRRTARRLSNRPPAATLPAMPAGA